MILPNNSIAVVSVNQPLLTWARVPRRRKRHYFKNKMSLLLLLFFSCCSSLILHPLDVQAIDFDIASSKGENMLAYDHHPRKSSFTTDNVLDEGEENVNTDKTNDNGIYEKNQLKTVENIGDYSSEEEKQRSKEIIEMLQASHTLRHQEHYKQKQQQQKQNDYPQKQKTKKQLEYQHEQQQMHDNNPDIDDDLYDDDDAIDDDDKDDDINDDEEHNRRLRYQQIQEALREPITPPTPHHHRHEHHFEKNRLSKQTDFKLAQHHLRHQHRQHKDFHSNSNRQPQLRHLNHEIKQKNFTTVYHGLRPKHLHQRYFDRQSSYSTPFVSTATTEGPNLQLSGSNRYWKSIANEYLVNPHNQLFNDDANTNTNQEKDIKRFSLPLDENVNEDKDRGNPIKEQDDANYDANLNVNDNAADEDGDYSYEDDVNEENKQNKYPSIVSSNSKTNVKRYTNPLRSLYKPSTRNQHMENGHPVKNSPYQMEDIKSNSNNDDDDYDDEEYNAEDIIKTSTFASPSSSPSSVSNASDELLKENDDVKFSEEKWHQIEHEHYRKQLQHQRDMQALRYRRPDNENSSPPHRYSSYSAASINPSPILSTSWMKRHTINNDDDDNIYSRYYVPGVMTHKKEEELGSPTAILESRRQYALVQRQNKALASAHHRRIVTEGFCRLPQPRVERIRRDSWKIYTPHCTILHRCADDAGCCPSERQTCAPKRTKSVELYFFVISLNATQGSIEKLTFTNHTECHCVERSKQRAPEYGNSRTKELISYNQIPFLRRATILNCYCPNLFEKILQEDGYCRCDCSSGNMGCDWLKRGMEHFSMNDRKCITEGRCKLPTCEYGQYIKKHGRCPRREERHLSSDVDW